MFSRLRALAGNAVVACDPVYGVDQVSHVQASLATVVNTGSPMSRGTGLLPISAEPARGLFAPIQNFRGANLPVQRPDTNRVSSHSSLPDTKSPDMTALDAVVSFMQPAPGAMGGIG